jgi:transcriptional regulator of arginine metabolism
MSTNEDHKLAKNQRQHRIARLMAEQIVHSQAHVVELLAKEGIVVNQATVSRDLEEMGAIKVRMPGGETGYALPDLPGTSATPVDQLRRVLGEWVVEIGVSGNLVLLRTPPGCAHVVASALDRSARVGVLGTVAGDDTVLVIATQSHGGEELARELAEIAGVSLEIE